VICLNNVYIATGENGNDVFSKAVVEYSADGQTWIQLSAGPFGSEVYLTGLQVQAQYVRMRNTDTTSTNWVKVRVFEANTTRTVVSEAGQFSVTTSLPVYMDNTVDRVLDGKDSTFFWSSRGVESGDYIMIDLGVPSLVHRVVIDTGVAGHTGDYIKDGELLWSADGFSWNSMGKSEQGLIRYENLEITARYIKLVSYAGQTSWFTMSRFDVDYEEAVGTDLYTDNGFARAAELYSACDNHVLTSFSPDPEVAAGHTLTVDVSAYTSVRLLCCTAGEGTTVTLIDKEGQVLSTADLTVDMTFDCTAADRLVILFGQAATSITEIVRR
jgi:hyaluronoglucosaminidase